MEIHNKNKVFHTHNTKVIVGQGLQKIKVALKSKTGYSINLKKNEKKTFKEKTKVKTSYKNDLYHKLSLIKKESRQIFTVK